MKVGDLVKQASNIFANREVAGKKMLVLEVLPSRTGVGDHIITLFEGRKITWHCGELEVTL